MQRDGGPGPGGGPGGGGNPTGGSFTGAAEALEIVGDHAYAYSGTFPATTSETTAFEFTTGNYLFVGKVQVNAFLQLGNMSLRQAGCKITLNGATIALLATDDGEEDAPMSNTQDLIIPAYTEVKVTVVANTGDADNFATVGLTGRIYRG